MFDSYWWARLRTYPELPRLFGELPRTLYGMRYGMRPMPEHFAADTSPCYEGPALT